MNCSQVDEILVDYLYGELDPERSAEVEAHLDGCPECAAAVSEMGWLRERVATQPDPEPSRMTINRILAHAREEAEKPKPLFGLGWLKLLAPLGLAGIIGGLLVFQFQTGLVSRKTLHPTPMEETSALPTPVGEAAAPAEIDPSTAPVIKDTPESELAPSPAMPVFRGGGTEPTGGAAKPPVPESPEKDLAVKDDHESRPGLSVAMKSAPSSWSAGLREGPTPETTRMARHRTSRDLNLDKEEPEEKPRTEAEKKAECPPAENIVVAKAVPIGPELTAWIAKRFTEGREAFDTGEFERGCEIFQAVVNSLPPGHKDRPTALIWLARSYENMGDGEDARKVYEILAGESEEHREMALKKIQELTN